MLTIPRNLIDMFCVFSVLRASAECVTALSEWSNLRCRTLVSAEGEARDRCVEAIVDQDRRAWEKLISRPTRDTGEKTKIMFPEELESIRSKLVALRDAVLLQSPNFKEIELDGLESMRRSGHPWDRDWDVIPPWLVHSQRNCPIEEVRVKLTACARSLLVKVVGFHCVTVCFYIVLNCVCRSRILHLPTRDA